MKQITAQRHAEIVLKSHSSYGAARAYGKEFTTFAKPGETQEAAIKRYMAARKRYHRTPVKREFPRTAEALASTRAYVEAYYQLNQDALRGAYADASQSTADYVASLFGELSTSPTVWPETDEVLVEFVD